MRRLLLTAALLGFAAHAQAQGLRIGMRDDPDILDPTLSRTYVGTLVMTAICDKLFDLDGRQAIVPVLASGYEWADPVTVVIRLRPGVLFQDGEAFDAAAVKYRLDRHATLNGSFRRSEIGAIERLEVVDPLTVRVVLKQPFSPLIAVLTDRAGMMVGPKAAEAAGKDFGLHPVCAGPFRFVERVAQDRVVLERFPQYWDAGRIHYDRVTYRVMPDSSIRLANLKAGALDIAEVAPLDVQAAKADAELAVVDVAGLGYGALTVNLAGASPIARDARVRMAFQLALDRAVLSQVVFAGLYEPDAQAISAASPYYAPGVPMPPHDVAAARALLRQAGVAMPLRVDLLVYNTPQGVQAGEVIQAMAAEAGFDVRVVAAEFGTVLAATARGEFQVTLGGWSGLLDPDSNAYAFLHTGSTLNIAKYSNPDADALLGQARAEGDPARRRALYGQLWRQVQADLPAQHPGGVAQGAGGDAARKRAATLAGCPAGSVGADRKPRTVMRQRARRPYATPALVSASLTSNAWHDHLQRQTPEKRGMSHFGIERASLTLAEPRIPLMKRAWGQLSARAGVRSSNPRRSVFPSHRPARPTMVPP